MPSSSSNKGAGLPETAGLEVIKDCLGRIGHDLSNLLTPVLAYPQIIKMELPDGSKSAELLEVIETTARDMVRVSRQMLDLSICQDFRPEPLVLNDVVQAAWAELKRELPQTVSVDFKLTEDPTQIRGGVEPLSHLFEHLVRNALEAMSQGGRLTVETSWRDDDPGVGERQDAGEAETPCLSLSVADTGKGVSTQVRDKVFQPFFTTKRDRAKRGAGLGLTYVYLVSQAHGGRVRIESEDSKGTRVEVLFPKSPPAESTSQTA